ncbi:unnamed protein product [Cylindrotheca closterium]|uniref:Major facilitator superfamily (MFS) profile domain-containing protein n=1 Tax=Cylindrotheca closterium TaxID=2856 RepID=A0AAD2FEY3_9STRA|nr:unnamed protein product [Cylindrotheca closterium]
MNDDDGSLESVPSNKSVEENTIEFQNTKPRSSLHESLKTFAGVAGNVLEWYDFAIFGFFSDVLGVVFFPKDQSEDLSVMESFAVFGGAFLMRPLGGVIIGYIGDTRGRKHALEISLFLMAFATTLMGCLPTYDQIGNGAILFLLLVRMLQGLSVGGQLMSSLVFTVEGRPQSRWGLYGSCVMAAGNFGTFLGGVVAAGLRSNLTFEQLTRWGWRIPFLSGFLISLCGLYLKYFCAEDELLPGHARTEPNDGDNQVNTLSNPQDDDLGDPNDGIIIVPSSSNSSDTQSINPLREAFSTKNRRNLIASAFVPMLWSGGFYLSFVWMAIFMRDLMDPPVESAFQINSWSLLLIGLWFPLAGFLSDLWGRKKVMTVGGIVFAVFGPVMILIIGQRGSQSALITFASQTVLSISLSLWGAPMCAWLVESFDPQARLTSVSIGYNLSQAIAGGMSPFVATLLVDEAGLAAPGILLFVLAAFSMVGLWIIAPSSLQGGHHASVPMTESLNDDNDGGILQQPGKLELKEIC